MTAFWAYVFVVKFEGKCSSGLVLFWVTFAIEFLNLCQEEEVVWGQGHLAKYLIKYSP